DIAIYGREYAQALRQVYQSEAKRHERIRSFVVARRSKANNRKTPQHPAVAQRNLTHGIASTIRTDRLAAQRGLAARRALATGERSEERRVGKECRCRWSR